MIDALFENNVKTVVEENVSSENLITKILLVNDHDEVIIAIPSINKTVSTSDQVI